MLTPLSLFKKPIIFLGLLALTILSACGGGGGGAPTYSIGGAVTGLSNTGLVLQNNGGNDLTVTADGSFNFSSKLAGSATYSVSIQTQPRTQTCTVSNSGGTVATANITSVSITCVVDDQDAQGLFTRNGDGSGTFNGVKKTLTDIKGMVFGALPNQKFIFFDIGTNVLYEGTITAITGIDFIGTATVYNDGVMVDSNVVVNGTVEAESSISMSLEKSNNGDFTGGTIEGLFSDEYFKESTNSRIVSDFPSVPFFGGPVSLLTPNLVTGNFQVRLNNSYFFQSLNSPTVQCVHDGTVVVDNTQNSKNVYPLINEIISENSRFAPCPTLNNTNNYAGFASALNDNTQGEARELWYAVTNGTYSVFAVLTR